MKADTLFPGNPTVYWTYGPVPADIRKMVWDVIQWFDATSGIVHEMQVTVVEEPVVGGANGEDDPNVGFAAFLYREYEDPVYIYLAAGAVDLLSKHPDPEIRMTRQEALDEVAYGLLHEVAHYEQFRDGRPVIERGVAVRGRRLWKDYLWSLHRDVPGPPTAKEIDESISNGTTRSLESFLQDVKL
jgi:hypothetical protein